MCQTEIDKNEFAPWEDLETIFMDGMIFSTPHKDMVKLWKLQSNWFVQIQRLKWTRLEVDTEDNGEGVELIHLGQVT